MIRVYRTIEQGERILIGADPADGGQDFCAAQVLSMKRYDVPIVFQARMESQQFGHELIKLAKYIQRQTGDDDPIISVERNVGMATLYVLQTNNYKNLYRMQRYGEERDEEEKIGWVTNTATRRLMLDALSLALKQGALTIYDKPTISELFSFVQKASGKAEAVRGAHDDLVMALAIALSSAQSTSVLKKEKTSLLSKERLIPHQDLFDQYGIPNDL